MEQESVRLYEAGDTIFREGERGDLMYVLLEGAVDLKKRVDRGETVLKVVSTPNEFFGEMALIDQGPRSASAVASTRTKLLAVDGPTFESMILANAKFALKIIKVLSDRIRHSNVHISELIETVPRERIAFGMADFARRHGERIHDGSLKVELEPMRAWINGHLGIAAEDIDTAVFHLVKGGTLSFAAKGKDHILLPERFLADHDRRTTE